MSERPLRLTDEIPLDELGASCIYCGHVVQKAAIVMFFDDAARHGLEIILHRDCGSGLSVMQVASAAAIRVCAQMNRGYYSEANNHGPMFERAMKEAHMAKIGDIVHYTNLGDRDGKYPPEVQAAIVTGVNENGTVALHVFYKTGQFDLPVCEETPASAGSEAARGKWSRFR